VVQRFLLDRVDAKAARAAVARQYQLFVGASPHETHAALLIAQFAVARAQVALQSPILEPVPVTAWCPGNVGVNAHWPGRITSPNMGIQL